MGLRFETAKMAGGLSEWALRRIFRRPAANFPGKAALYIDPELIAELRFRLREGSVVVVGTNGKTTVTNLLADAFEVAGKAVVCNRTGANLDSGVASALLAADEADWGVLESDELWLAKTVPQLRPRAVVLLNLFRDQLDRMGEIDHIQDAIARALASSPETALIYNADDPLCQAIAGQVPNDCIAFGFDEDLGLASNIVSDAAMCQCCDGLLSYEWRQYGQLGAFRCPSCGFARMAPRYAAADVVVEGERASFTLAGAGDEVRVNVPYSEAYMLYNVLAVFATADYCGVPLACADAAIARFEPHNGRLQRYEIAGRHVLLNLAKNPTGFNQNLRLIEAQPGPAAVAFFINDKEADGHDVSWLWDVDFQELADSDGLMAYAGGIRHNDMQVRLKHAGIHAELVDGASDFLAKAQAASPDARLYLIANYTALPIVKAELDQMAQRGDGDVRPRSGASGAAPTAARRQGVSPNAGNRPPAQAAQRPPCARLTVCPSAVVSESGEAPALTIVHLYPELLNLYGDGGNVTILANRARWRGIDVEVVAVNHGQTAELEHADVVFLGGGPDREQHLASADLMEQADVLRAYVEDDGVLLAICGGYQILGRAWVLGDGVVPGLGILDVETKRAEGGSHSRLVGDITLESPLAAMPVVGYENHAGRTYLGGGCVPFGHVIGKRGCGNNEDGGADGARYRNVVGTYLHGPLLAKNPEVADWLIERALERRAAKEGLPAPLPLAPLDDSAERAANQFKMSHFASGAR